MTAKIILNPYAGRWKGLQSRPAIEQALKKAGLDYDLVVTECPEHGIKLAAQAVREGFSPIVSAGGDGSLSEVINGVAQASQELGIPPVPVGLIPAGTANDFAINLSLPTDIDGSVAIIADGVTRSIDLGEVTAWNTGRQVSRRRFIANNSGIGLEPTVTLIQMKMTRMRGILRYLVAALRAIARNPQWTMRLQWDGGEYEGPITVVTVGNNPLTGGVFYMSPHADPYDGKLSAVYGYMATRLKILQLLPRTMKPAAGSYVEHPAIHEVNLEWLKVHSYQPTPVHADGEILFSDAQDIEYRIYPAYLPVLTRHA